MDEQTHITSDDQLPVDRNEEDLQGNLYEFYLLLQKLKTGGTSFDQFLERATIWAKLRAVRNR